MSILVKTEAKEKSKAVTSPPETATKRLTRKQREEINQMGPKPDGEVVFSFFKGI